MPTRVRLAVLTVGLLTAAGIATPGIAHATSPVAAITTISPADRWNPRVADILGANSDGFVYRQEIDPGLDAPGGGWEARWHSTTADDDHSLGNVNGTVVGDHLVNINFSTSPAVVTDQPLPSGTPSTVSIPSGETVLAATGDGVLVATQQLVVSLLPWGSSTLTPVTGFPASPTSISPLSGASTEDAHGALLQVSPNTGGLELFYVDTSVPKAWELSASDAGGEALGSSTISWLTPLNDTDVGIATVPRPQSADTTVGAVSTRAADPINASGSMSHWTTLPLGGGVLVWQAFSPESYFRGQQFPMDDVDAGGTATEISSWAHSARIAPDGSSALIVDGDTPETSAISSLSSNGTTTSTVVALAPVPARTGQVAVDGSRVVTVDDSALNNEVETDTVTASAGVASVSDHTALATPATADSPNGNCTLTPTCASIVASRGMTTFVQPNDLGGNYVTYDGTTHIQSTPLQGNDDGLLGSDGRSVLIDNTLQYSHELYTIATGTEAPTGLLGPSLANGELWSPTSHDPQDSLVETDDLTNAATSIPLPAGCGRIDSAPQVAGRWLMMRCAPTDDDVSEEDRWAVVDQTGAISPWIDVLSPSTLGSRWLGDGFVVKDDGDQNLMWTDLTNPAHTWQALGSWTGAAGTLGVDETGAQATVAWIDADGVTNVAVLPLITSVDVPSAPTGVTVSAGDAAATVSWTAATANGSAVTGYRVIPMPACPSCTGLAATGTSTKVSGLTNGKAYHFTIVAGSAIGYSPASSNSNAVTPVAASALSIGRSTLIPEGTRIKIVGALTNSKSASPIAGASVKLLSQVGGRGPISTVATVRSTSTGQVSWLVKPSVHTNYAWYFAGTSNHAASISRVQTVGVAQVLTATLTPKTVRHKKAASIYGTVRPNEAGKTVVLQQLVHHKWKSLAITATIKRQLLPNHKRLVGYVLVVKERKAGTFTFRVSRAATRLNEAGVSPRVKLKVT